ncbi:MAG: hypothetical protein CMO06_02160 [Thalassospira sp.]|nr:hypothetical protein [Thalassospira sp.]
MLCVSDAAFASQFLDLRIGITEHFGKGVGSMLAKKSRSAGFSCTFAVKLDRAADNEHFDNNGMGQIL